MGDQIKPLQPGEPAPAFTLPAVNADRTISLADLHGRPFLIGLFRGLHCPFCRRQIRQLSGVQPALRAAGVETLAVINTSLERARLYFRFQPTPVVLLSDPDCLTHRAFGVPRVQFLPEGSTEQPEWPERATVAQFEEARINPEGEMAEPTQPMEANFVLNAKDGFELDGTDQAIFAEHATQLVGHFLVDAGGIVRWAKIEARHGPNGIGSFPAPEEIVAAANGL
jgi:peroxiredoxin